MAKALAGLAAAAAALLLSSCAVPTISDDPASDPPAETFYPAAAVYADYDGSPLLGARGWNEDGTFTFQHENTLTTLSAGNQVLSQVVLPPESLPGGGVYDLSWSESHILAIGRQTAQNRQYGAVYFTGDGGVHLANLTLFDRQGRLVRQYPAAPGDDGPAVAGGAQVVGGCDLSDGSRVYWLDGEAAIFNCHDRIVLYDFAADAGRVLDDMSPLVERHGKFGVYYGADLFQCGVSDGVFYYLAHREEEAANNTGSVWCADREGARPLFDGQQFWHLFVGRQALMLLAHADPAAPEGDDLLYCATGQPPALQQVWQGACAIPFAESGPISFSNRSWHREGTCLFSYDPAAGRLQSHSLGAPVQVDVLFTRAAGDSLRYYYCLFDGSGATDWAYDTATGETTRLTGEGWPGLKALEPCPSGEYYVEYALADGQPQLRVCRWGF